MSKMHAREGFCFERLDDGSVRVSKVLNGQVGSEVDPNAARCEITAYHAVIARPDTVLLSVSDDDLDVILRTLKRNGYDLRMSDAARRLWWRLLFRLGFSVPVDAIFPHVRRRQK